jgi:ATP-dependent Clp protease ATP-binding subunit ClpX
MRLRKSSLSHLPSASSSIAIRSRPPWSSSSPQFQPPISTTSIRLYSNSNNKSNSQFRRSDFGNQPFTGSYDPNEPTAGPLGGASSVGAPKITPKMLKQHLDEYVIGQDRAKKVLSTAVYNHYQRIQELQRQEQEYQELERKKARRDMSSRHHPVEGTSKSHRDDHQHVLMYGEDEFPGSYTSPPPPPAPPKIGTSPLKEPSTALNLEKSNVLLLGPSGVGKTLMVKTLASILDVPFTISDCTPLTSAGYIGEDAEVVVQRLLAASNYDVAKAETGIICLDEFDKIASVKVSHGKDVGGEGVQQALLKIIEGTSVSVQAKNEKISPTSERERHLPGTPQHNTSTPGKNEVYTVRTENILFICAGAFNGLHKNIMDRIAKGSIGFNAPVRASNDSGQNLHDTTIQLTPSNTELYKEHLPYSLIPPASPSPYTHPSDPLSPPPPPTTINILDLVTPTDLHKFGLIPELIGRVPIHTAVSPLTPSALERVLTEPRNALLKQYTALFALSNITLHFTAGAIRAVAKKAAGMGTGARALRGVIEGVLGESMFEVPGSGVRYVIVTEEVVGKKSSPVHLERGQGQLFDSLIAEEAEKERLHKDGEKEVLDASSSFQEYREQVGAAGS